MANNPYVNKVVYGNNTLIDISNTTATAGDVATTKYFYTAAGARVAGTLAFSTIYTSTSSPSSSQGSNGDVWLKTVS